MECLLDGPFEFIFFGFRLFVEITDEVRDDLGVCFAFEGCTFALQPGFECGVVFDYTVVYDGDFFCVVEVWVCVCGIRPAVRGPSGVSDAEGFVCLGFFEHFCKGGDSYAGVFDFDGVIAQSNSIRRNAYYDMFNHVRASRETIKEIITEAITEDLKTKFPEINEIDDVHLWTIIPDMLIYSAHVKLNNELIKINQEDFISKINDYLLMNYKIIESTIQITPKDAIEACNP